MGGASENDNAMKWFLERSEGGDILVIRASGSDGYNDYLYSELGVAVNSVETIVFHDEQAASDSYVLEQITNAEAIWIAGGDQWDYISYWRGSPVSQIINENIANKNIVIGGTSAGMAILGGIGGGLGGGFAPMFSRTYGLWSLVLLILAIAAFLTLVMWFFLPLQPLQEERIVERED